MKKLRRVSAVFVIVSLLVSLLPAGGLAAQEPPPPVAAYIWRSDVAAADGYKSLIEAAGFEVTVVHADDVAGADLSAFDLFVVGADTGYAYEWGPAGAVRALREARKPLLGLGYGGACLFGRLGLSIEWGNGWVGPETRLIARDPAHPVFTTPYAIDLAADGGVTVYTASDHIGQYAPALSASVELVAYEPASEDHYPLVREGRAVLWGFTGSPYALTTAGEQLFINTVAWTGTLGSASELLPDLVVSDVWLEGTEVCYQLCNFGDGPAEAGHTTAVLRDGELFATDEVDVVLGPGERQTRSLRGEWHLADEPEVVRVIADADDVVLEHDEANAYEETWRADTEPPRITAGPAVSAITQTSAVVSIQTDEPSQARVRWGTAAGVLDSGLLSGELATAHTFTLAGLDAATTYQFVVSCADEAGNRMMGELLNFQTLPPAETTAPEIAVLEMPIAEWPSRLLVDATDDSGIASVRLAVDGVEQAVDYSAPFEFLIDPLRYTEDSHEFTLTAVDRAGNESQAHASYSSARVIDPERPKTTILSPLTGEVLSGEITVSAKVTDDIGVTGLSLIIDGESRDSIEYPMPYPKSTAAEFVFDTRNLDNGKHRIAVLASDGTWRVGYGTELATIDVDVENVTLAPPKLTIVKRQVAQLGTAFQVVLTVKNSGEEEARNVVIVDPVTSFQPISSDGLSAVYTATGGRTASSTPHMEIRPREAIPGGRTRTYSYKVVPFMSVTSGVVPMIGNGETEMRWESPSQPGTFVGYDRAVAYATLAGVPIFQAHADALKASMHLIVTSPDNLQELYGAVGADQVLSTAAELAIVRDAVLGYLDLPSQFSRSLEAEDVLAVGDLTGDDRDEILLWDASAEQVVMGRVGEVPAGFAPTFKGVYSWQEMTLRSLEGFTKGDDIAVSYSGGPFGKGRIVWLRASEQRLRVMDPWGDIVGLSQPGTALAGQKVLCGDVIGDERDEIIRFSPDEDEVSVFTLDTRFGSPGGSTYVANPVEVSGSFKRDIEDRDLLAVGDVTGDERDEIIVGDVSAGKVLVLSGTGALLHSFPAVLAAGDRIAVGRPIEGSKYGVTDKALIVHASRISGWVSGREANGTGKFVLDNTNFEQGDLFASVGLTQGARDSVLIGNVSDDRIELHHAAESSPGELLALISASKGEAAETQAAGEWSTRLHPEWVTDGLLTIVGETEIVPSWGNRKFGSLRMKRGGSESMFADLTDMPYSNTYGTDAYPELALGRIIGNSVEELCKPMRASIGVARGEPGYGFDRSKALLVSGFPSGFSGGSDSIDFTEWVLRVESILLGQGVTNQVWLQTPNFIVRHPFFGIVDDAATRDWIRQLFFGNAQHSDIVFLAGHGSPSACDEIYATDVRAQQNPFGGSNPVVFAASCSTGVYTHHNSFANAMLDGGAAAYIGATQWSVASTNKMASKRFYLSWQPGVPAGVGLRDTKRYMASVGTITSLKGHYWMAISHFFGDPAFGTEAPPGGSAAAYSLPDASADGLGDTFGAPGATVLEVTVPDYEVSTIGIHDEVEIPGGLVLSETGRPEVPIHVVTREVPKGLAVGDVRIVEHSEPLVTSGLDLPPVYDVVASSGSDAQGTPEGAPGVEAEADSSARGWWPGENLAWTVIEGIESDTLVIELRPFEYDARTTDARFFKHWTLAVDVHEAPVRIAGAKTRAATYPAGSPVTLDVALAADEAAPDVTIEVAVRSLAGEALGGFPVRTLRAPGPYSALSLVWQPGAAAGGPCIAEVVVRGPDGRVFDRATAEFSLGAPLVRADSLTASPEHFTPGQTVGLSLGVANEGDIPAEGSAVLTVLDASGAEVASLREDFDGLAAGDARVFDFAWDTAGLAPGVYTARALAHYAGRVSNALTLELASATPHADAGPDRTVERDSLSGASVTLDGSGSFHPDGTPLTFAWTWEGGIATGVSPVVVLPIGLTTVTLTVSDGTDSDTDTVDVLVVDTTAPALSITVPDAGDALQDGVTLGAHASDLSGVAGVWLTLRADDGGAGEPVGCENMPAALAAGTLADGTWTLPFDTSALTDGAYTLSARALDAYGNEARTQALAFTVRNWALVELLPASARYQPGRTVPIKFSVRVCEAVDASTPFVYNEELEVRIYDARWPSTPLQVSRFGPKAKDYRIDVADELYITNFTTAKQPSSYLVEVWRPSGGLLVGSFGFVTSK
ncbi:MAG: hypothetical protein K0B85_08130 [Coriobacteriia bacterium]|nr:hypothetical protein [Coriobacteriia bacterium]